MLSYILMVFNFISRPFSGSTISSDDASEDCRIFAELCRQGASLSVIQQHHGAIMAKCARNPLYRSSKKREMPKYTVERVVSRAVLSLLLHPCPVARSQMPWGSSGAGHADAGIVPGTATQIAAQSSMPAASSSNGSIMLESDGDLNVELAPPLGLRVLFGNEANTGVAVRNVIELSGASSDGVVAPLVWIGFLASLFAPLVRRKWPRFARDLSLIGHISTAWWHLVLLSTKYHSEQYTFVNATLSALFCVVVALALIKAGKLCSWNQNPSSGGSGHADAGVVSDSDGVVSSTAGARNYRIPASSSNVSIRVESDEAVNVELAGGFQPSPLASQGLDYPVHSVWIEYLMTLVDGIFFGNEAEEMVDLESQTHVEESCAEYRVTLVHRVLFGNEANTGVAVRNVIELSGASSDGVVAPLVWIGFLASLFAPLVRRKWPRFARDLSQIGHISTAWWHLVLLSTKYHSEQYAFVNATLTALFCIVVALALIKAGR